MQVGSITLIEVLVPLFVGIAFRTLLPQVAQRIREPIVRVAKSILSVACVAILVVTLPIVWGFIRLGTLTMYVAFTVLALGVGHVMRGPEKLDRARVRVCAPPFWGRHQHRDGRLYLGKSFGAAVILLVVVQGIVCSLYVKWQRRHVAPAEAPPVAEPSRSVRRRNRVRHRLGIPGVTSSPGQELAVMEVQVFKEEGIEVGIATLDD